MRKKELLLKEGILHDITEESINLGEKMFQPNVKYDYLSALRRIQKHLSAGLILEEEKGREFRRIVGVDVAYVDFKLFELGIVAAALFDTRQNKILRVTISMVPIFFPYIPTYLAFRELPPVIFALKELEKTSNGVETDLIIVDGHGILHPRGLGIASHIGVLLNKPTIGVAKKLLVGKLGEQLALGKNKVYPVILQGEVKGYLIEKTKRKKIIISPGNLISPKKALEIVLSLNWTSGNTIDIVYFSHKVVTALRKKLKNILSPLIYQRKNIFS